MCVIPAVAHRRAAEGTGDGRAVEHGAEKVGEAQTQELLHSAAVENER